MANYKTIATGFLYRSILIIPLSAPLLANDILDSWYIGGQVGISNLDPDTNNTSWKVDDGNDLSKKIYTGIKISESFGVEGFWSDFGSATLQSDNNSADIDYSAYGINLIYQPRKNKKLSPFAKLGAAKVDTESDGALHVDQQNDMDILGGIGTDFSLTESIKLRAEYEMYDKDLSQAGVGLHWSPFLKKGNHQQTAAIPAALPIIRPMTPTIIAPKPVVAQKYIAPKPVIAQRPIVAKPLPPQTIIIKHVMPSPAPRPVIQRASYPPSPPPPIVKAVVRTPQPAPPKPKMHVMQRTLNGGSYFSSGSFKLTHSGQNAIRNLVNDLKRNGFASNHITITGHTDSTGSAHSNLALSKNRAFAVGRFMQSQGIPMRLMTIQGKGESQPISSNSFSEGRAKNRRVDIRVHASKQYYR